MAEIYLHICCAHGWSLRTRLLSARAEQGTTPYELLYFWFAVGANAIWCSLALCCPPLLSKIGDLEAMHD